MSTRLLVLVVASIVGMTVVAGPVAGAEKTSVVGTYTVTDFGLTSCAPVGASGFMLRCDTTGLVSEYVGDLTGVAVADFTALINCKTGREVGHGAETFTGTLGNSAVGTLSWTDQFSADIDCATFFPSGLDINSVAVKGSGEFAGMQGKLHFTDTDYTGTLH